LHLLVFKGKAPFLRPRCATKFALPQSTGFEFRHQPFDLLAASPLPNASLSDFHHAGSNGYGALTFSYASRSEIPACGQGRLDGEFRPGAKMFRAAFRWAFSEWAHPHASKPLALYGSRRTKMWGNPRLSQMTTSISFTNPSVSNDNIQGGLLAAESRISLGGILQSDALNKVGGKNSLY
jgi:hypothetical protein